MPIHIGEMKILTKIKSAVAEKKDQWAAKSNTKQASKSDDEAIIQECIRRVMEIMEYKLH